MQPLNSQLFASKQMLTTIPPYQADNVPIVIYQLENDNVLLGMYLGI